MKFIKESAAAEKMGYNKRYFRRLVTSGTLNISYRKNPSGRKYEYDAVAIETEKNKNAKIICS